MSCDPNRLLSIQSHVCSGYVGNRAATFPLQLMGYDVDVVNTVQFSNHTGYGHTNGHKTTAEQLTAVFAGLSTNGLTKWGKVLTGYIPGAESLKIVEAEVRKLKRRAEKSSAEGSRSGVVYLLDPVMGDIGKGLYVAEDVVPIYRRMLRLSSIITPNAFELEILSEHKIASLKDIHTSLRILHSAPHSVPFIALSSISLPLSLVESLHLPPPPLSYTSLVPPAADDENAAVKSNEEVLVCFASTRIGEPKEGEEVKYETWAWALPFIDGYYSGVGDLFSALVLGHFQTVQSESQPSNSASIPPFPQAVSLALLSVQQILLKTHLHTLSVSPIRPRTRLEGQDDCLPSDPELDAVTPPRMSGEELVPGRLARRSRLRELRLVQERRLLMDVGDEGWPAGKVDWRRVEEEQ